MMMTFDEPAPLEERWEWLMREITPEMERALKQEAYRILGSAADVQDVMQETLIKAVVRCSQLRDRRKLFQWLFTITRREAYSHYSKFSFKKLWGRARLNLPGLNEPGEEPEARLLSQDDSLLLKDALDDLDEQARRIVVMKSATDDSLKGIADKLGLNYQTTRSKYQRALSALRRRMQEGGRADGR